MYMRAVVTDCFLGERSDVQARMTDDVGTPKKGVRMGVRMYAAGSSQERRGSRSRGRQPTTRTTALAT